MPRRCNEIELGTDTYKLGSGNDLFLADDDFANNENDGNDIVNGGRGIDTYNLADADTIVLYQSRHQGAFRARGSDSR